MAHDERGFDFDELNRLERDIALAISATELAARLDVVSASFDDNADVALRLRLLIAKGTIQNRQRRVDQALMSAHEARQLAADEAGATYRSRISRLMASIHFWSGSGEKAMSELLRAIAEARLVADEQEMAASLADGGRACKEIKRYDLALLFFRAALASPALDPLERQRIVALQLEMLNRLRRNEEALELFAANATFASFGSPRTNFLLQLERARALAGTSDRQRAQSALNVARSMLPDNPGAYEHVEWQEAARDVEKTAGQAESSADAGKTSLEADEEAALRNFISRYRQDALHEKEADARLDLAHLLNTKGDSGGAMREAAAALALAVRRREPRIQERARTAMLRFGDRRGERVGAAGLVLDRYLIGEQLGKGGFGLVRRAYDLESGTEYAVKFIDLDGVTEQAKRKRLLADAKAEIDAASRACAPGLIRIHSAFVDGNTIAIVQDLQKGRTLEEYRGQKLDVETALLFFIKVANALEALHEAGVVHRDLKPSNIMVDQLWRPTLIDLGLATLVGAAEDEQNFVRGTKNYIAPELRASTPPVPDPRQDIFAFGVILSEFLPPDVMALKAGLLGFTAFGRKDRVAACVSAMCERSPSKRPATAAIVAAVLEQRLAEYQSIR